MSSVVRVAAVLGVMLGGCTAIDTPVHPVHFTRECAAPWFVGEPMVDEVHWDCELGQEGRTGAARSSTNGCKHALEVSARCGGVECTTSSSVLLEPGYNGMQRIEVVPTTTGRIEVIYDLKHLSGHIESIPALTCNVLALPTIELGCVARDPGSGEFVPCPDPVPQGWEISFTMHGSVPTGEFPRYEGWYDDRELSYYREWREIVCSHRGETENVRDLTCTTAPKPGHHSFAVQFGQQPKQMISVDVR